MNNFVKMFYNLLKIKIFETDKNAVCELFWHHGAFFNTKNLFSPSRSHTKQTSRATSVRKYLWTCFGKDVEAHYLDIFSSVSPFVCDLQHESFILVSLKTSLGCGATMGLGSCFFSQAFEPFKKVKEKKLENSSAMVLVWFWKFTGTWTKWREMGAVSKKCQKMKISVREFIGIEPTQIGFWLNFYCNIKCQNILYKS